ncbi:MAG: Gfo/Idh/MocA family oxidoreductase [Planctomycetaceae bacterium]|nr:Gfo/Idh/MocA family oxidoreductase [Planctomycetaceae bacterium]
MTVTRRDFLAAATATASTVVLMPYLFSSEQPVRRKGANERLNIGAIGTSQYRAGVWDRSEPFDGRGATIARHAAQFGEMVAVADAYRPFAEKFASYFPQRCRVCRDYQELLADTTIDAVTIGTPDHWHVKIAIEALKAGKHVYVEKPLSLTMDETRQIVKVAKETGKIVQVGSQQRTENETFRKAAAICRSGRLGNKFSVICSCPSNESVGKKGVFTDRKPFKPEHIPEGLDWNLWLGQAPLEHYFLERCFYNFRWWKDYSGGEITNWGGHNVDFAVWAINVFDVAPVEISGTGKFPGIPGWYDTAEEFDVDFKYADGHTLKLCSGINEVIISGERGRIRVNRGSLTGRPVEQMMPKDEEEIAEIMNSLMNGKKPGNHMRNFFDSIEDGMLPVSDVFSTASGINMCHMANICLLTGRTLRWNQEKFEFENDREATAMIARKPREGFDINV